MMLLTGKLCFMCEVEGMEHKAMDTNLNLCPCCHTLTENTPKLLAHVATHVLYDTTIDQSSKPCRLCLKPSLLCKWVLWMNKGAIAVDFAKSVTNCDTATSHVTGLYVYNSIVSLCFFFSLNINRDTPLKVIPEQLDTSD